MAAKVRIFTDAAKYPRHIFKIRADGQVYCQIRDSQRVITPKNRKFRPFLPCFGRSPLLCTADGTIWRRGKKPLFNLLELSAEW